MSQTTLRSDSSTTTTTPVPHPWYRGVTAYQWLVLAIASLGWIFDAFEGQLYNITRGEMLPDLLRHADPSLTAEAIATLTRSWGERFLGIFLIGGTLGGWVFSSLADRWGRMPVMALTILFYSIFSGLTALSNASPVMRFSSIALSLNVFPVLCACFAIFAALSYPTCLFNAVTSINDLLINSSILPASISNPSTHFFLNDTHASANNPIDINRLWMITGL